MDSPNFTPAQRFYSAQLTAKLVESPTGNISDCSTGNSIRAKHIFYGVIIAGALLAIASTVSPVRENHLTREKLNV